MASLKVGATMNLGYLMIQNQSLPERPVRAERARELGFSEFYSTDANTVRTSTNTSQGSPELSSGLRLMLDLPKRFAPQVVSINGERQLPSDCAPNLIFARPAIIPEQVRANVQQQQATLSVSWLNKTELARHWAALVTGSTHAGHRARPEDWRIARTIVVSSDEGRAEAAVKSDDSPCRAYYAKIAGRAATSSAVDALIERSVLFGSLQSVLDELREISLSSGPFGTLTLVDHAWPDAELAEQSLASIAAAITPVTRHNRVSV